MTGALKTFRPSWIPPRLPPRPPAPAAAPGPGEGPGGDRSFYWSAAWRALRLRHLAAEPLCRDCLGRGVTRAATTVHHVVPIAEAPGRRLDPANLASACNPCHNRLHPEKGRRG